MLDCLASRRDTRCSSCINHRHTMTSPVTVTTVTLDNLTDFSIFTCGVAIWNKITSNCHRSKCLLTLLVEGQEGIQPLLSPAPVHQLCKTTGATWKTLSHAFSVAGLTVWSSIPDTLRFGQSLQTNLFCHYHSAHATQ